MHADDKRRNEHSLHGDGRRACDHEAGFTQHQRMKSGLRQRLSLRRNMPRRDRIIESSSNRALDLDQQLGIGLGLLRPTRHRHQPGGDRGQPQRPQAYALIRGVGTIERIAHRIGQAGERAGQVDQSRVGLRRRRNLRGRRPADIDELGDAALHHR